MKFLIRIYWTFRFFVHDWPWYPGWRTHHLRWIFAYLKAFPPTPEIRAIWMCPPLFGTSTFDDLDTENEDDENPYDFYWEQG